MRQNSSQNRSHNEIQFNMTKQVSTKLQVYNTYGIFHIIITGVVYYPSHAYIQIIPLYKNYEMEILASKSVQKS